MASHTKKGQLSRAEWPRFLHARWNMPLSVASHRRRSTSWSSTATCFCCGSSFLRTHNWRVDNLVGKTWVTPWRSANPSVESKERQGQVKAKCGHTNNATDVDGSLQLWLLHREPAKGSAHQALRELEVRRYRGEYDSQTNQQHDRCQCAHACDRPKAALSRLAISCTALCAKNDQQANAHGQVQRERSQEQEPCRLFDLDSLYLLLELGNQLFITSAQVVGRRMKT
mmetsp:Transcript_35747/g.56965  ORF Transcript_35747/g.56965 Transcript_35747/m.56965 type:complete len:227 (+) Transcript_35747:16-696(+)